MPGCLSLSRVGPVRSFTRPRSIRAAMRRPSSFISLGFALHQLGPERIGLLGSAFGGKMGRTLPEICINRRRLKAKKRLAFGSKSSMCVHVGGSRLTGGLPSAPIAA